MNAVKGLSFSNKLFEIILAPCEFKCLSSGEITKFKAFFPVNPSSKFVKSIAWRDSKNEKGTIYKAELYLDNGDLAAVSEAVFVQPKNYESLFENM